MMAPDMWTGWGIRTLSAEHAAYNPFSYQLGSVWLPVFARRYGMSIIAVHDGWAA